MKTALFRRNYKTQLCLYSKAGLPSDTNPPPKQSFWQTPALRCSVDRKLLKTEFFENDAVVLIVIFLHVFNLPGVV